MQPEGLVVARLAEHLPPIHQRPIRQHAHESPEQSGELLVGQELANEHQLFGPVERWPVVEVDGGLP